MSMNFRMLVSSSIVVVVVSGCGSSQPPSCSSSDVQDILRDIMREEVMKEYVKNAPFVCSDAVMSGSSGNVPPEFIEFCKSYGNKASDAVISISSIRTQGKDEVNRKSECAASIQVERKSIRGVVTSENEVNYTAQYTDDGSEIYVQLTY